MEWWEIGELIALAKPKQGGLPEMVAMAAATAKKG